MKQLRIPVIATHITGWLLFPEPAIGFFIGQWRNNFNGGRDLKT
jgi:hypothetical protein